MIKTFDRIALAAGVLALAVAQLAPAQTILTETTLSAAITSLKAKQIVVASATNISAPTTYSTLTSLYIDKELLSVEAVNGTTITVARGQGGTASTYHASGALVFVGVPNAFFVGSADNAGIGGGVPPQAGGSCTRGTLLYLPSINVETGVISDCVGGAWVNGVRTTNKNNQYRLNFPTIGAVAYTGLNTNGTAVGATTVYCTEIDLPYNKLITGLGFLEGTTVTGNARYSILYDAAGNAIANGALAGIASVTASVFENYAFTTPYYAVGPAQYFGCLQDNAVGSTTVRMMVTGIDDNVLTVGQTGATFGTVPALSVPTAFHSAVGPYLYVY
jgi:hypothetical protein